MLRQRLALGKLNILTPAPNSPGASTRSGSMVKVEAPEKRRSSHLRSLDTLLAGSANVRSQLQALDTRKPARVPATAAEGQPVAGAQPPASAPKPSLPGSSGQGPHPTAPAAVLAALPAPAALQTKPAEVEEVEETEAVVAQMPNSKTHRSMWMACSRISLSKTGKVSNEWTNLWKSGGKQRAQLFKHFVDCQGNVDAVELIMQRERAADLAFWSKSRVRPAITNMKVSCAV